MDRTALIAASLAVAVALVMVMLRYLRRGSGRKRKDAGADLSLEIGFSDLDGMASLALLVSNKGDRDVWVEEIEIFLTELEATFQAGVPTYRGLQPIREKFEPGEKSSISLSTTIYKAGGECQRWYSFVLSSVVRFRIGEEWNEKQLENYRVEMIGFVTASLRRDRRPLPRAKMEEKPLHAQPVGEATGGGAGRRK